MEDLRQKARRKVYEAVNRGELIKYYICELCSKYNKNIYAHHQSYSSENWLKVIWLCNSCHRWFHKEVKRRYKRNNVEILFQEAWEKLNEKNLNLKLRNKG